MISPPLQRQILITGSTSGIGLEMAHQLLNSGHRVVITGRNSEKMKQAENQLKLRLPKLKKDQLHSVVCDLSKIEDLKTLAQKSLEFLPEIDVFVHNAGIALSEYQKTEWDVEMTLAVNHFAGFFLTQLLYPQLSKALDARIITTSSGAHKKAKFSWDDWQLTNKFSGAFAYCNSKLFNIWFTQEIARKAPRHVSAFCFHPGVVKTNIGLDGDTRGFLNFIATWIHVMGISAEKGARTGTFLCTNPFLANKREKFNGQYFYKADLQKTSKRAKCKSDALQLWQISLELSEKQGIAITIR